jgi:hypothetical protein
MAAIDEMSWLHVFDAVGHNLGHLVLTFYVGTHSIRRAAS